jgi:phage tail sheath protein FI
MPPKYSTPGVYLKEKDESGITTPAGTSVGGIVLTAPTGPVNRFVTITSDQQFINTFGTPIYTSGCASEAVAGTDSRKTPEYGYGAYAALEFLKYSNRLNVLRIGSSSDRYANAIFVTSGGIRNETTIAPSTSPTTLDKTDKIAALDNYNVSAADVILVGATGPGIDAHNMAVGIEFFSSACDWKYRYDDYNATATAANLPIAAKVFKMNIYTKSTKEVWPTTNADVLVYSAYNPVETFYGTVGQLTDQDGNSLQIDELVNGNSNYVYVKTTSSLTDFSSNVQPININGSFPCFKFGALAGGAKANENTGLSGFTAGFSLMNSKEDLDMDILIVPTPSMDVKKAAATVAATRQDCIVVTQTAKRTTLTAQGVIAEETYGYTNPSYVALYAGWDLVYDQYNDRKVYLPKCIFGAAAMARTDSVANVWDAPAGYSRGVIGPALDQNVTFSFADVGVLYDANINTSRYVRGVGNVLWGQKTSQLKASSLDRIAVRRTVTWLESSIEQALQQYVLDITNTDKNRLRVWANIDSFLATVKSEGGLTAYECVCDSSNNTAAIVDQNVLVVDCFLQPVKAAEFIQLNMTITRTGVTRA